MKFAVVVFAVSAAVFAVGSGSAAAASCDEVAHEIDADAGAADAKLEALTSNALLCEGGEAEETLLRAYAAFKARGEKSREAADLRAAVKDYQESGGKPLRVLGLALSELARRKLAKGSESALDDAVRAAQILAAAAPDDRAARAPSFGRVSPASQNSRISAPIWSMHMTRCLEPEICLKITRRQKSRRF